LSSEQPRCRPSELPKRTFTVGIALKLKDDSPVLPLLWMTCEQWLSSEPVANLVKFAKVLISGANPNENRVCLERAFEILNHQMRLEAFTFLWTLRVLTSASSFDESLHSVLMRRNGYFSGPHTHSSNSSTSSSSRQALVKLLHVGIFGISGLSTPVIVGIIDEFFHALAMVLLGSAQLVKQIERGDPSSSSSDAAPLPTPLSHDDIEGLFVRAEFISRCFSAVFSIPHRSLEADADETDDAAAALAESLSHSHSTKEVFPLSSDNVRLMFEAVLAVFDSAVTHVERTGQAALAVSSRLVEQYYQLAAQSFAHLNSLVRQCPSFFTIDFPQRSDAPHQTEAEAETETAHFFQAAIFRLADSLSSMAFSLLKARCEGDRGNTPLRLSDRSLSHSRDTVDVLCSLVDQLLLLVLSVCECDAEPMSDGVSAFQPALADADSLRNSIKGKGPSDMANPQLLPATATLSQSIRSPSNNRR
jgi:hypothetical protein